MNKICLILAATLLAMGAHAAVTPVAWYRLGENDPGAASGAAVTNQTTDLLGTRHLNQTGGPRYTNTVSALASNRMGSSLGVQFGGAGQYLLTNALVSSAANNFGIEAWVNPATVGLGSRVIAYNGNTGANGWGLYQFSNTFRGVLGGVTFVGSASAVAGTWVHLALVRNNGTNRFFRDGAEIAGSITAPIAPSGAFALGGNPTSPGSELFNGAIDEVRVFTFAPNQFAASDLLPNVQRIATLPASGIGPTNAAINGRAHAAGLLTHYWFEWGTTTNYGNVTGASSSPGGGSVSYGQSLLGLAPDTTHHFRAVLSNVLGVVYGTNQTFQTLGRPMAVTLAASGVTQNSATFNGLANSGGLGGSAWFEFGFSTNYGNVTPPQAIGGGTSDTNFSHSISGLLPGLAYHFRAVASNSIGVAFGQDQSFPSFAQQAYLKAGNTQAGDAALGFPVAVSGDTIVVGVSLEDSSATGVNGDQNNNSASSAGAAFVYVRSGNSWALQAYLKASNTDADDRFGGSVAISGDTIVVGATGEDSNATGVNGDQSNNSASFAGAAYVFVRTGTNWTQQAFLKASNTGPGDGFGRLVAVSGDTVVVGAPSEDSFATAINGDQNDNSATNSGAAYVFARTGTIWAQQAYLKPSNTDANDNFGSSVAVSGDTVVVGAPQEDSTATGVNGNQGNAADLNFNSGAAYVFVRVGNSWSQQAYLKASTSGDDRFGESVAISGHTVVIGAPADDSNGLINPGAAYVFIRAGSTWSQQAFLTASNIGEDDFFGRSVAISGDTVVVAAESEDSNATGVDGNGSNDSASNSGAAYLFTRVGSTWSHKAYLKASNTGSGDFFGNSVAVSGETIVVGALGESSNAIGVNGDQNNNNAGNSGAGYVFGPPLPGTPEINVLQSGTNLLSGDVSQQYVVAGTLAQTRFFTIRNTGSDFLTGLTITITGPDAAVFGVTAAPVAPVTPTGSTVFSVRFAPTRTGTNTATLHIASNDEDENPFDLQLNGLALSFTEDRDGDGLNDAAELQMASLGFNFQVSQTSLVNTLFNNANGAGLFTQSQLQALSAGSPLLSRDTNSGLFKLTIGVEKAAQLTNFFPFPMTAPQTIINPEGKLEFQFGVPDNAGFFRLEAR